jgi:hypothetical protein
MYIIAKIISEDAATITFDDGITQTIYVDDPNWNLVLDAVKANNAEMVRELLSPELEVKHTINAQNLSSTVRVNDANMIEVFYDGSWLVVDNALSQRMLRMLREGFDIKPMAYFLSRLQANPSYRAREELFEFLEFGNLPITDDGCFLAYKRVKDNYMDVYTGTIDNSVGAVVEMPRRMVNDDSSQTCSSGLHFCSREYLPHYGASPSTRVMLVKIDPADVVSIPADYNNTKGRCCRYEVVQELDIKVEDNRFLPENIEGLLWGDDVGGDDDDTADTDTRAVLKVEYLDDTFTDYDVIAEYVSVDEAAFDTGIPAAYIRRVLRGNRKTTAGYGWLWADESDEDNDDNDDGGNNNDPLDVLRPWSSSPTSTRYY